MWTCRTWDVSCTFFPRNQPIKFSPFYWRQKQCKHSTVLSDGLLEKTWTTGLSDAKAQQWQFMTWITTKYEYICNCISHFWNQTCSFKFLKVATHKTMMNFFLILSADLKSVPVPLKVMWNQWLLEMKEITIKQSYVLPKLACSCIKCTWFSVKEIKKKILACPLK